MIPRTKGGRLIAATGVLLLGLVLWQGRYFIIEPWRLVGFELGAGASHVSAPETVNTEEPIKITFTVAVTGTRPIKGRWKNVVLNYRLNEEDYQALRPVQHKPVDDKHEEFVFIIPPQSKVGVIEFGFECVFDGDQRRIESRKQIRVT